MCRLTIIRRREDESCGVSRTIDRRMVRAPATGSTTEPS
jgi:hypothetical protein